MATVNPLSWFSSSPGNKQSASLRPRRSRNRHRALTVESLEAHRVLTAIVMSPYEQLLLELINRARSAPGAEAARYGIDLNEGISSTISDTPKQPLAPSQILVDAAAAHSADMLEHDYFSHTNLAGQSASDRAIAAGYPVGVWENISWGGSTGPVNYEANVYSRHERLFLSTTGHRQNMLHSFHQEVGPGVRFGQYTTGGWTYNVGMVTENFGNPPGNSFLTGVVFTDASDGSDRDNDFYNIGEQVGSGTITATENSSGQSYSTAIGPSGGYSLQIPAGTYTVSATGGALPNHYIAENVVLGSENVKVDFETTTATLAPGQVPVTPELTVTIADAAISEYVAATTGTVSRTGNTFSPLVVLLSSDDTGEAIVPISISIPAGQASINFTIDSVDDNIVDGTQTVTISASAIGFIGGSDTLDVLDDDVPEEDPAPAPVTQQFDFGTSSSPLETGYLRVTGSTNYNATLGYGWAATVNNLDRGTGSGLTRDLHYRDVATFVVDVPNGTYDVTLTVGDEGPYAHDQAVYLEGLPVDSIATAARQVVTRNYTVAVDDGQLTLRLDGRGGVDPNMVISGLQVIAATSEETTPTPELAVTVADPAISEQGGTTSGTVSRSGSTSGPLIVTLSSDDTGEAIVPSSVIIPAGDASVTFTINGMDDDLVDGTQTVTISASATGFINDDESLEVLDDDVPEEDPTSAPVTHQFDFGTWSSPLESGYTRVSGSTTYHATLGYGWFTTVNELDRGTGSELTRDLHYRDVGTFVVDVPDGTYDVTLTVGDAGPFAHDQQVFLEGTSVDTISTAAREVVTRDYTVTVTDGQLTLRLDGRGGVDPNMVISGLQVIGATREEPTPTPELTVTTVDAAISENGGSTIGTVSRTGSTTDALLVTLSSDDTGEATVPATVTIPAGYPSVGFTISAVDDNIVDGNQTVTINASASDFSDVSDTLDVLDDDVPEEPAAAPVTQQFDFGTSSSPLESGYARVSGSTTYNTTLGYGWTAAVNDLDRRAGSDLSRDLHYRDVGTFLVDVHNGTYDVILTVGDEGPYAHDQTVYLEGASVDSIRTAGREIVTRTYEVTVNDGQLTLRLDGRGGVDPNMVISGLQVIETDGEEPTPTPELTVTTADAAISENGGTTIGTVSRSGSTSEPLQVSLLSNDTSEATVPESVTIPTGQTSATFTIDAIDDNVVDGFQTVTILATAASHTNASNTLDVLDNDVPIQESVSERFDFGTWSSPLESGSTRVTGTTTYNSSLGHGWLTAVHDLDRGTGTDVTRDLHYRDVGTFVVDVTAGTYLVRLDTGDEGPYRHDQQVILEGTSVDSIATAPGQMLTRTYAVTVDDGQLTLRLDGRGGVDPNMVISGLQVIEVPSELATPTHLSPENLDNLFAILDNNPNDGI